MSDRRDMPSLETDMVKMINLVTIYMFASACGKADSNSSKNSSSTEIEGTWTQSCGTDDPETEENKNYDIAVDVISGNNISSTWDMFTDNECKNKYLSIRGKATFIIGDLLESPSGAKGIDYQPTEIYMTALDSGVVSHFNGEGEGATKLCGGGWVLGQERKLTNENCKDSPDFNKVENKSYGIYKIEGNQQFGGDGDIDNNGEDEPETDGTSAAKRPKVLDTRPSKKS